MGLATIIKKNKIKEKQVRVLILGLDGAGKSTVVARWMGEDVGRVAPTFGFQIRTMMMGERSGRNNEGQAPPTEQVQPTGQVHFWDVGGQKGLRAYWRNYFEETDGLVFVIDSVAVGRFAEVGEELRTLLRQDRLANATCLLLANKQDCKGAMAVDEIRQVLGLDELFGGVEARGKTRWRLLGCSAIDDVCEGEGGACCSLALDWLLSDIYERLFYIKID